MPPRRPASPAAVDSVHGPAASAPASAPGARPALRPGAAPSVAVPETVWVTSTLYRYGFSTAGGALVSAELLQYRSFAASDSGRHVDLIPRGRPALVPQIVAGNDTVALTDWRF